MDAFLAWLDKYDLLIELVITALTITLSLLALFQTKNISKRQLKQEENIAKQQADLQERQIKISVYEQKNEINRTLNIVFDAISSMSLVFKVLKVEKLSQDNLYGLLIQFLEKINVENTAYTLEQSRFFFDKETALRIRIVRNAFSAIVTSVDCLNMLKEDDEAKNTITEEIKMSCVEIEELEPLIKSTMIEELKLIWE